MVKGKTAATGKQHQFLLTNKDKNSEGYPTGSWRICWNLLTSRTHNGGGGCGFETAYSKTTIWGFKINPRFCENQSVILWKSVGDLGKVGVWFWQSRRVILWKSASDVVKISQWFCENRSAILVKSERDFGKVGVWFCENQPVMFWKSEWDFGKVGVWFL